jgi:hypothetical protein
MVAEFARAKAFAKNALKAFVRVAEQIVLVIQITTLPIREVSKTSL